MLKEGMEWIVFQQLLVSLGLGLLLGLERERSEASIAGIRTFPFISLFGTVCAQIGQIFGGWIVAAGLLALAAVVIFANVVKMKAGDDDPGMTTEIAMLLLYALGAYIVIGNIRGAAVIGGVMAVLLHLKKPMHDFAAAVGDRDMRAIMQFVVVSLIILPVLPHEKYGPYEVWSPFNLWLMVVLIVGISLCGYVAYKIFGAKAGTLLGGIIGGIVSSTATTVSFARRASAQEALAPLGALVIMIASGISVVRVLVEIAVVAPGSMAKLAPPLATMLLACIVISAGLWMVSQKRKVQMPEQTNPAGLKSALIFAALYAVVLLAVAAGKDYFGSAGLYVVGLISGLTDVDAITISCAQLAQSGQIDVGTGWRTILIAIMANFAFKLGIVGTLGSKALAIRVGLAFALAFLSGGAILWLWPDSATAQ